MKVIWLVSERARDVARARLPLRVRKSNDSEKQNGDQVKPVKEKLTGNFSTFSGNGTENFDWTRTQTRDLWINVPVLFPSELSSPLDGGGPK